MKCKVQKAFNLGLQNENFILLISDFENENKIKTIVIKIFENKIFLVSRLKTTFNFPNFLKMKCETKSGRFF